MPATFLTLPRELRDEALTYAALSSSFSFLRTCRQLNEEGTPLLYKHGRYCMRALTLPIERDRGQLPVQCKPPPIHLIQNLYITMPPLWADFSKSPNYEIPRETASLLEQFRGTEIPRRVCHFYRRHWTLTAGMAKGLSGLVGFEVVRVEVWLRVYPLNSSDQVWLGVYPIDPDEELERRDKEKDHCVRLIEEGLGSALGKAKWEQSDSKNYSYEGLVAEFRPWRSTS